MNMGSVRLRDAWQALSKWFSHIKNSVGAGIDTLYATERKPLPLAHFTGVSTNPGAPDRAPITYDSECQARQQTSSGRFAALFSQRYLRHPRIEWPTERN